MTTGTNRRASRREGRRSRRTSPLTAFTLLGALGTAILVIALREWTGLYLLPAYLVAINLATFLLYAHDKLAARAGWTRVPERVLHVFAFLGGTPLAFVAQQVLRHKTAKTRFRIVFWILAVLQAALVVWAFIYWR